MRIVGFSQDFNHFIPSAVAYSFRRILLPAFERMRDFDILLKPLRDFFGL